MDTEQWLLQILLGGLMGMIGQGIRTLPGLKKLHDKVVVNASTFSQEFSRSTFITSLFIGFIIGVAAIFTLDFGGDPTKPSKEFLLGLMAAGYGGTDFIEGFSKRYLPKLGAPETEPAV